MDYEMLRGQIIRYFTGRESGLLRELFQVVADQCGPEASHADRAFRGQVESDSSWRCDAAERKLKEC